MFRLHGPHAFQQVKYCFSGSVYKMLVGVLRVDVDLGVLVSGTNIARQNVLGYCILVYFSRTLVELL